jgi:hypothetical protein
MRRMFVGLASGFSEGCVDEPGIIFVLTKLPVSMVSDELDLWRQLDNNLHVAARSGRRSRGR